MHFRSLFQLVQRSLHSVSLLLLLALSLGAAGFTLASALGYAPWLILPVTFGVTVYEGGQYVQIAVTALLLTLFFFIPSNGRIIALERSHRSFALGMEDVARAYHLCHTADRSGVFTLSSEFDSVRERLSYLREHPALAGLEPEVLEVAAQMSHTSKHLADVYNDEKVTRAKAFLTQRQEEAEAQQERILQAQHAMRELKHWGEQVELEESVVASQMARLEEQLMEVLPPLGYQIGEDDTNVVPITKPAAE
jgi:hypothetical protein